MDNLQFIAAIIESCAWPLATVALIFSLRGPVVHLLGRATSAEGFGAKLTFGERIEAVREITAVGADEIASDEVALALPAPSAEVKALTEEIEGASATGSIVLGWARLESGLRDAVKILSVHINSSDQRKTWAQYLLGAGFIDSSTFESIVTLKKIRNEVVHNSSEKSLSLADSSSYNAAVDSVLRKVNQKILSLNGR